MSPSPLVHHLTFPYSTYPIPTKASHSSSAAPSSCMQRINHRTLSNRLIFLGYPSVGSPLPNSPIPPNRNAPPWGNSQSKRQNQTVGFPPLFFSLPNFRLCSFQGKTRLNFCVMAMTVTVMRQIRQMRGWRLKATQHIPITIAQCSVKVCTLGR